MGGQPQELGAQPAGLGGSGGYSESLGGQPDSLEASQKAWWPDWGYGSKQEGLGGQPEGWKLAREPRRSTWGSGGQPEGLGGQSEGLKASQRAWRWGVDMEIEKKRLRFSLCSTIGHRPIRGRCPVTTNDQFWNTWGALGTADQITLVRLYSALCTVQYYVVISITSIHHSAYSSFVIIQF